jgi:hypothetical protein
MRTGDRPADAIDPYALGSSQIGLARARDMSGPIATCSMDDGTKAHLLRTADELLGHRFMVAPEDTRIRPFGGVITGLTVIDDVRRLQVTTTHVAISSAGNPAGESEIPLAGLEILPNGKCVLRQSSLTPPVFGELMILTR